MTLSTDLISQFAKITNDSNTKQTESTVYGTIVISDDKKYVRLDGSNMDTPITSTTDALDGDRVMVMIKNHSAVVIGNITSPSARKDVVDDLEDKTNDISNQVTQLGIVVATKVEVDQLNAEAARIEKLIVTGDTEIRGELEAESARIEGLIAGKASITDLEAINAEIDNLDSKYVTTDVLESDYATIGSLDAVNLEVRNLSGDYATFKDTTTDKFTAIEAEIDKLDVGTLTTDELDARYATIDFSNIGELAMENFYANSGLIEDVVVGDGTITGNLVGVTISGDLIEGNTIKADKLVILGDDGLYYKLNTNGTITETEQTEHNSINGSIITANTITATKINVDDLVAFDATIGGFNITDNSIYSGVKSSIDNSTQGVYLDSYGQLYLGDAVNFLKYYKDADDNYKLEISADTLCFGTEDKKSVEDAIIEKGDEIYVAMSEQNTNVLQSSESIIIEALKNYTESNDFNEFKNTVESQLSITAEQISMNYTSTIERLEEINGELQSQITTISKHITTSENGINIFSGENGINLQLDNDDGIIFSKNGVEFGYWDGVDFHTGNIVVNVNERAQFGNFAFIPRSDGSLMFLKVGDS